MIVCRRSAWRGGWDDSGRYLEGPLDITRLHYIYFETHPMDRQTKVVVIFSRTHLSVPSVHCLGRRCFGCWTCWPLPDLQLDNIISDGPTVSEPSIAFLICCFSTVCRNLANVWMCSRNNYTGSGWNVTVLARINYQSELVYFCTAISGWFKQLRKLLWLLTPPDIIFMKFVCLRIINLRILYFYLLKNSIILISKQNISDLNEFCSCTKTIFLLYIFLYSLKI